MEDQVKNASQSLIDALDRDASKLLTPLQLKEWAPASEAFYAGVQQGRAIIAEWVTEHLKNILHSADSAGLPAYEKVGEEKGVILECNGENDWKSEGEYSMLLFADGTRQLGKWEVNDDATEEAGEFKGQWVWEDIDEGSNAFNPQPTHFICETRHHQGNGGIPATPQQKGGTEA